MRAGQLRKRVIIQRYQATQGLNGEITGAWATFQQCWAKVEPLSGRELFAAQQIIAQADSKITIRYFAGVIPTMQILFGVRVFNIQHVANEDERNRKIEMLCQEMPTGPVTGILGTVGGSKAQRFALTGSIDGVNTVFTVPSAPDANSFQMYWNGILAEPGTDFTLAGSVITMAVAPAIGDKLIAYY